MSVKLIDNDAFYGYRARRTVNGTLYQEYFSLRADRGKRLGLRSAAGKQILKDAQARDAELLLLQQKDRRKRRSGLCFQKDGSVRGISYVVKGEKYGRSTPIFQTGVSSSREGRVVGTSYSLNAHGKEGAWRKAVESYAYHKDISKRSTLYKQLLDAMDATIRRHQRRSQRRGTQQSS